MVGPAPSADKQACTAPIVQMCTKTVLNDVKQSTYHQQIPQSTPCSIFKAIKYFEYRDKVSKIDIYTPKIDDFEHKCIDANLV